MSVEKLNSLTRKQLEQLARKHTVAGWETMRKAELIKALARVRAGGTNGTAGRNVHTRSASVMHRAAEQPAATNSANGHANGKSTHNGSNSSVQAANGSNAQGPSTQDGESNGNGHSDLKPRRSQQRARSLLNANVGCTSDAVDRLKVDSCDPYWLRARWRLSQPMLDRAEVALGSLWHQALPVIRVFDVSSAAAHVRVADVEIHGETDTWFIPVNDPPRSYRLQIGYLAPNGTFFALAGSNVVATRCPNTLATQDGNGASPNGQASNGHGLSRSSQNQNGGTKAWSDEDGPAKTSSATSFDTGSGFADLLVDFPLEIRAELVVSGRTHPKARLSLMGNHVAL